MSMCISTSKETIIRSNLLLKTLERKLNCFYSEKQPTSEYIFEYLTKGYCAKNSDEDTIPILAVARYDEDSTYAVLSPETLSVDERSKLFKAFADGLWDGDQLIVFTRLDKEAANEACHGQGITIRLVA